MMKLLISTPVQTGMILELSHTLEVHTFQIGDEITSFEPSTTLQQSDGDLYLVLQGQARVLCFNSLQRRNITALLLELGETFGADHLFSKTLLPYRVVAASTCQIARIPPTKLFTLLHQMSQLKKQILQQVQERERLIFFKALTQLYSLPNWQIRKHILPKLVEDSVKAGEPLVCTAPESNGYFWLRSGKIQSRKEASHLLKVGEGWSPLNPAQPDWIAQTDLLLYKLPLDSWEVARILDLL